MLARPGLREDAAYRVAAALARTDWPPARPKTPGGVVPAERTNPGTARLLREAGVSLR